MLRLAHPKKKKTSSPTVGMFAYPMNESCYCNSDSYDKYIVYKLNACVLTIRFRQILPVPARATGAAGL